MKLIISLGAFAALATIAGLLIARVPDRVSAPPVPAPVRKFPPAPSTRPAAAAILAGPSGQLFHPALMPADLAELQRAKTEPDFRLVGIVGRSSNRVAMIHLKQDDRDAITAANSKVAGWKIEAIETSCIAVRRGKSSRRLCV